MEVLQQDSPFTALSLFSALPVSEVVFHCQILHVSLKSEKNSILYFSEYAYCCKLHQNMANVLSLGVDGRNLP